LLVLAGGHFNSLAKRYMHFGKSTGVADLWHDHGLLACCIVQQRGFIQPKLKGFHSWTSGVCNPVGSRVCTHRLVFLTPGIVVSHLNRGRRWS